MIKNFRQFLNESSNLKQSEQIVQEFCEKYPEHACFFKNFIEEYPKYTNLFREVRYFFRDEGRIDPYSFDRIEETIAHLMDDDDCPYPGEDIFIEFYSELSLSTYLEKYYKKNKLG